MPKEEIVRDDAGNPLNVRVTDDDGRTSQLHEYDGSLLSDLHGHKGEVVERAIHDRRGKTEAYEADNSLLGRLINGGYGERKRSKPPKAEPAKADEPGNSGPRPDDREDSSSASPLLGLVIFFAALAALVALLALALVTSFIWAGATATGIIAAYFLRPIQSRLPLRRLPDVAVPMLAGIAFALLEAALMLINGHNSSLFAFLAVVAATAVGAAGARWAGSKMLAWRATNAIPSAGAASKLRSMVAMGSLVLSCLLVAALLSLQLYGLVTTRPAATVLTPKSVNDPKTITVQNSYNADPRKITAAQGPPVTFAAGDRVQTTALLNVRSSPAGPIIGNANAGTTGTIVIDGPQSAGDSIWCQVRYEDGMQGWSSAMFLTRLAPHKADTLAPATIQGVPSNFAAGERVQATSLLKVRSSPNGLTIGNVNAGMAGTVIDGPQSAGSYTWWQIRYEDGMQGWSAAQFLVRH